MFSNTAYEAMYQYLGLALHSKFIELITSQKVFLGVIVMIFGTLFFITTIQFFSRYLPGALLTQEYVPLSKYVRIIMCLFLGMAILKIGANTSVKQFSGRSWHDNSYIRGEIKDAQAYYKVSFVFDLISRTAEETAAAIGRVIDSLFQSTHSQLDAPNFFYKAILYASTATLDDPNLKSTIKFYTDECFDRILPLVKRAASENKLDGFFADRTYFDQKLSELKIETPDKTPYTCLDLKNEVRQGLREYGLRRPGIVGTNLKEILKNGPLNDERYVNLQVSNALANTYFSERETYMGLQKGAMLPTTGGRIFQYFNRTFSWDGALSFVGGKGLQGAALAAKRSQEFNENLERAPHIAGFIKMVLIAIFPWLVFAVVAGYWRALAYWFLLYFSVLLWTPIWTLLYHIMTSISISAETMEAFGKLNDGISLYGSQLITHRMYHMYAVFSWLQVLIGTLFTGTLVYFIRPALSDTENDGAPDFVNTTTNVAMTGARVTGVLK